MISKCASSVTPRRSRRLSVRVESTLPSSLIVSAKRQSGPAPNVLADIGKLNFPYQGTTVCYLRESAASTPGQVSRLLKGLADAVVLIHDPSGKPEIVEILRKAF